MIFGKQKILAPRIYDKILTFKAGDEIMRKRKILELISSLANWTKITLTLLGLCIVAIVGITAVFVILNHGEIHSLNVMIKSLDDKVSNNVTRISRLELWTEIPEYIADLKPPRNPRIISRITLFRQNSSYIKDFYDITGLKDFYNSGYADWSPGSQKMAFISVKDSETKSEQSDIEQGGALYIYDINENSAISLTNAEYKNLHPKFSPDAKVIVFSTYREDKERWDIATITADNKNFKILTSEEVYEVYGEFNINYHPSFSPDGNHIIFCAKDTGTEPQVFYLFLMDKGGNNRRKICELGGVCDASFSPNGDFIVFQTQRGNDYHDIWIAPIVNGQCITDACPIIDEIKSKIPGLVKEDKYYFKKLTNIGPNPEKPNGHIDPEWINNDEIIYLFTDKYERGAKPDPLSVNWTVKKINIYTGYITDYPLLKENKYRNPAVITKFKTLR